MGKDAKHNKSVRHDQLDGDNRPGVGTFLQKERLKKQLSLEDVAQQTCIHITTLCNIENNVWEKMPAEVFARGFIKLYADLLGLDKHDVLEQYDREKSCDDENEDDKDDFFYGEKITVSRPFFDLRKCLLFFFLLVLFGLGYYFFLSPPSPEPETPPFINGSVHE